MTREDFLKIGIGEVDGIATESALLVGLGKGTSEGRRMSVDGEIDSLGEGSEELDKGFVLGIGKSKSGSG